MSTSPEVKQAAGRITDWTGNAFDEPMFTDIIQQAIDAATAKLVAALTPFASAANELTLIGRSVKPEEQWLWKPSSTGRDTAGINAQHLLDARAALTGTGQK